MFVCVCKCSNAHQLAIKVLVPADRWRELRTSPKLVTTTTTELNCYCSLLNLLSPQWLSLGLWSADRALADDGSGCGGGRIPPPLLITVSVTGGPCPRRVN